MLILPRHNVLTLSVLLFARYKVVRAADEASLLNDFKRYGTRLSHERMFLADSLLAACRDGDVGHVRALIEQKVASERDQIAQTGWSSTPRANHFRALAEAVSRSQSEVSPSSFFIDALGTACEFVQLEVVDEILASMKKHLSQTPRSQTGPRASSRSFGDLCHAEESVNTPSARTGWRALQRACGVGDGMSAAPVKWQFSQDGARETIVRRLLEFGANPDASTPNKQPFDQTPVWIASRLGLVGVLKLLVKHGATVNCRCGRGATPLIMAAHGNHIAVAELLISNRADLNAANDTGTTPLHMAAQLNNIEVLKILLQRKADPDVARSDGATPLYLAAQDDFAAAVDLLLRHRADSNKSCDDGESPVFAAAESGCKQSLELLLEAGSDANACRSDDGCSPLQIARTEGHTECVALLLANGAT